MKKLKRLMTDVAKGKLTMEEAMGKSNFSKKTLQRGSVKPHNKENTHKRKKAIKLREVKK